MSENYFKTFYGHFPISDYNMGDINQLNAQNDSPKSEGHTSTECKFIILKGRTYKARRMNYKVTILVRICCCPLLWFLSDRSNRLTKMEFDASDIGDGVEIHLSPSCHYNKQRGSVYGCTLKRVCNCSRNQSSGMR